MIWFIRPEPGYAVTALLLVGIASIGFELGTVFYNAMLPGVARPEAMGRVSGIGWAMGYGGGLVCLALCLVLLVQPDPALFGLNREAGEHIRATALLVGAWMMIFCGPVLIAVRDPVQRPPIRQAISTGLSEIARLLRSLPREPVLARFLLARLFYTDGLNTLFAFGAIYAAGRFGMGFSEILLFGILLNITAGLGALLGGMVEDGLGSRRTVLLSLGCIILISLGLLLVEGRTMFWVLGGGLGLFFGPAQAASRTLMARLAPPGEVGAWFGLFALSGRVTGFIGPALLAIATAAFASQQAGMAVVVGLMALGFVVLLTVRAR
jgi:UMF1 family MFS transporter